jgi:malate dehydrogenase
LELRLLDIHHCQKKLEGTKLEIDDSAYPLVDKVVTTINPAEAFQDADVAILLGGFPRKPGMQRNDLIAQNASIMKEHVSLPSSVLFLLFLTSDSHR